jgi:hypothetical protein
LLERGAELAAVERAAVAASAQSAPEA